MKKYLLSIILIATTILLGSKVYAETIFDYEPNDSPYAAYELKGDTTLRSTIADSDDVDYYSFYINGSVNIVITLVSPENADYDLKLFDENYNEIGSSNITSNKEDIITKFSLGTGRYFIKVYCFNKKPSDQPYTLSTQIFDITGTNVHSHAGISEANKKNTTLNNALEIAANMSFKAKIGDYNEKRYYKFSINQESDVDISMTPPNGADYDIKLYNISGLEIGRSTNTEGPEKISERLLPGTYFLKVYSYGYALSSDTYEVTLKSTRVDSTENRDNSSDNDDNSDSGFQTPTTAPRSLLLYIGPGQPLFSDEDLKKLLIDDPINTKDFIITENGPQYNTYYDKKGNLVEIVTPEIINSMTKEMLDSTAKLDQIKEDYLGFYKKASRYNSLDFFASQAADLAVRMIKIDPEVKLTIAIPGIRMLALSDLYIEPVKEKIIKGLKEKLDLIDPKYWEENIRGFYYSTEEIPYYYTWFKPDKTINFDNPVVKTMLSLSNEIHQVYNKEFMWIPYYGNSLGMENYYNKDHFVRIGYIANRTNIFDYVFIQPSYYFKSTSENIPYVKVSSELNAVVDKQFEIVGGIKSSKTLVGPEMEIDIKYSPASGKDPAYRDRYNEYVDAFSGVNSNTPVAFYAGSRDDIFDDVIYNEVKQFFKRIQNTQN